MINGVGADIPIESDENGYHSSPVPYRMDLMPATALLHLAAIMAQGSKTHGEQNWRKGSVEAHLNKALVHAMAYLAGDESDDHLGHSAWRMVAALELALEGKPRA